MDKKRFYIVFVLIAITVISTFATLMLCNTHYGPTHPVPAEFQEAIKNGYHWVPSDEFDSGNRVYDDGSYALYGPPQSYTP